MTVTVVAMATVPAVVMTTLLSMKAMRRVTMPNFGAMAGPPMMPAVMMHVVVVHERPDVVVMMMWGADAYGHVDAGRSQRRHGEGGSSETQCSQKMLGEFHVGPFNGC